MTKKQIAFVVAIVSMMALQILLAVGLFGLQLYNAYVNSSNVVDYFKDSNYDFENDNLEPSNIFYGSIINNNGKIFEVQVEVKDGKYEVINFPSYIGYEGETIVTGGLEINISNNNNSKTYTINSFNEDNMFILNTNVENIRILESLSEESPDILMISEQLNTDIYRMQCFYIKDNELERIMFNNNEDLKGYIYTTTFFSMVDNNRFEHILYDDASAAYISNTYFFDMKSSTFIRQLEMEKIETIKAVITMDEAVEKVENINNTELDFICYENMRAGQLLDGYPTEYYYIVLGTLDGEIYPGGCYYVNMYTGEIYFNGSDGSIYRVADNTYIGIFGDLPKVVEY